MKKVLSILTVAALALAISSASFAANSKKFYGVTNDDNPSANTATVFSWTSSGLAQVQVLDTGGTGIGGGYFANPRITIASKQTCLFVSDAGSSDIASFAKGTGPTFNKVSNTPSGAFGSSFGTGLVLTPDGKTLFASLDANFQIASFTVNSDCTLTAGPLTNENDSVGPMAITSDGKVMIVPEPNNGVVDAFTISGTTLTPLGSSVVLGGISSCSVGCFPTGTDISTVSGGNATVVLGNATLSGPYYITIPLNTSTGLSSSGAATFLDGNTSNANLETPEYSKAGLTGNGFIYMGMAGFGSGFPAGVTVNQVTGGTINSSAIGSYTNTAAFYASNAASMVYQGTTQRSDYLWQVGNSGSAQATVYVYKVTSAGAISQVASLPDAQGNGAFVLTIGAFPPRGR